MTMSIAQVSFSFLYFLNIQYSGEIRGPTMRRAMKDVGAG
jgi:hypothetical protein